MNEAGITKAARLRRMLSGDSAIVAPGVYDGLSARLVERAGFGAVYASGGAISRSRCLPDLGLLSSREVVDSLQSIVDAVSIPVIADADTGYGNALNVSRTVREFERAGVAALHLEDQVFPKKCGHLEGKAVISLVEMQKKIVAAKESFSNPDMVLIARTDALAVEGLNGALERGEAYAEAGADLIFVEAPTSRAEIEAIARGIRRPLLINMFAGGKTPLVPTDELFAMGYRVVIIPSDLQRASIGAMNRVLAEIRTAGHSARLSGDMVSFSDREEIVGTSEYLRLEKRYQA